MYEARVLAAAEELEALASELDDEELELDPACAVACMRLLTDVFGEPAAQLGAAAARTCARESSRSGPASRPGGWLPRATSGPRRGRRPRPSTRAPRDAGVLRRFGDRLRDRRRDPPVEDARHDVVGGQLLVRDDKRQRLGGRKLHRRRDLACPDVERPRKTPGNASTLLIWFG